MPSIAQVEILTNKLLLVIEKRSKIFLLLSTEKETVTQQKGNGWS